MTWQAPPSSLEVHLLGTFRLVVDGASVEERRWSRRLPKLLVKLLALQANHQIHREQAMEILCPDLDGGAATNSLSKAIHAARHVLEPDLRHGHLSRYIHTHNRLIALAAPGNVWIDVEDFERRAAAALQSDDLQAHEEAVEIYGGELLPEDLYEDWVTARRERLRGTYHALLARLARLHERAQSYTQAIACYKKLVTHDPADEEAHCALMRLYAATGERRQALKQYRECHEQLRRGLDVTPSEETKRLHREIAAGCFRTGAVPARGLTEQTRIGDSLAILPLINESGDAKIEFLSDGIAENLIASLARLSQLRVVAWRSAARFKGREVEYQLIARELRVRKLIVGSVRQVGEVLVVNVELIDAADERQLWGAQYREKISDLLAVQDKITAMVAEQLRLQMTHEKRLRLTRHDTEEPRAYQLFMRGRFFASRRTEEGLEKGIDCFQQAIALDQHYAHAFAGIAECYSVLPNYSSIAPREGYPKAKRAALKALELDVSLGRPHAILSYIAAVYDWDMEESKCEILRCLELDPHDPLAWQWFAIYLVVAKDAADEAVEAITRALEIDPLSPVINAAAVWVLYFARRFEHARQHALQTLELDANSYLGQLFIARVLLQLGEYDDAVASFRMAYELSCDNTATLAELGHALAAAGEVSEAREILEDLRIVSRQKYVTPYYTALIHKELGDREQAFGHLEQAFADRSSLLFWLKAEPRFESLRPDPRFADLLRRISF